MPGCRSPRSPESSASCRTTSPRSSRTSPYGVTAEAANRFDKAVALQDLFRSEFEYSLTKGPEGSGVDDLEAFLTPGNGGRVGYCEQFAASMAVMARVIGIPARMAVGFLKPRSIGDGVWEYSAHDLHAWPELYFDGFGWVRFEPTPGNSAIGAVVHRGSRGRRARSDLRAE